MKNRLTVTPAEASELMRLGYEIECTLVLPPAPPTTEMPKQPRKYISNTAKIAKSVEGKVPTHGKVVAVWAALDKEFFYAKNPTATVPAQQLRDWIKKHPDGYSSMLSHLVNTYKVLRIVK